MKKLALLLLVAFNSIIAGAQLTATTAIITDSDGTVWTNESWSVQFVPAPNFPNLNQYYIGNTALTSNTYNSYLQQSGNAGGNTITVTLLDNNQITPAGSKWRFTVQSKTSAPAFTFLPVLITGTGYSLSSYFSTNVASPRFNAGPNSFGYADIEVTALPQPGGGYFNVTLNQQRTWNGTNWATANPVSPGTTATTPNILTLVDGQTDETFSALAGSPTIAADNTNYQPGRVSGTSGLQGGWNIANTGATTTSSGITFSPTLTTAPIAAIGAWIYIPSGSLASITSISIIVQALSGHTITGTFNSGTQPALTSGYQLYRISTGGGSVAWTNTETIQYVYVNLTTTAGANITVANMWAETPAKAIIVLNVDGPYNSVFLNPTGNYCSGGPCSGISAGGIAYVGGAPDLDALGIPYVMGVFTGVLGTGAAPNDYATWAQIKARTALNPNIEINDYGNTQATASLTCPQLLAETELTLKSMEANGYQSSGYKSIWPQGLATFSSLPCVQQLFLGLGTYNQSYGTASPLVWPPTYQWNIPRYTIGNTTTAAAMHALFTSTTVPSLLSTHGLFNWALPHGVDTTEPGVNQAVWGQLLDEIKSCLQQNWCEVVTYQQLAQRAGTRYVTAPSGGQYIIYFDQTGTQQKLVQP